MRKYLVGIFIGVALTISSSVFAEDIATLIGVKVQGEFPVKLNGAELAKPAIVINGTSYLPNRVIADALGMDIKFDADLGIELKTKEVEPMSTPNTITTENVVPPSIEQVYSQKEIDLKIRTINSVIWMLQVKLNESSNNEKSLEWHAEINKNQDELTIWETRKAAVPK